MTRALNATGRPIVYSCSWPAYQGGLPPKVRVVLPVVGSPGPWGSSDCVPMSCTPYWFPLTLTILHQQHL